MSVLVAFVREAQPGRPAEVREALRTSAQAATQEHRGIRTYQVLQGRAQSNLYVELVEWENRRAFQRAMDLLRGRDAQLAAQFLRSAHVRVYRPLEIVRVRRREPQAVSVGLVRVKPGSEAEFARIMAEQVRTRLRERPGLLASGLYQGEDEPQQFLIRNAWDSEEDMLAHRAWIAREALPTTDPHVSRRELLDLLMRWHYRQTPLASPEAV
ncbi:MAG TPA: antibiotic biosynthesis monooxygenase [Chloroflexota bacterium]|nr:antibiotic biosynthesis monooxygenase [Chloroflexota bacterium]